MLKSRPDKEANCGNSVPAKQNAGRSSLKFLKSIYAQDAACARGLLERTPERIFRATTLGARFLNDLQSEFLDQDAQISA